MIFKDREAAGKILADVLRSHLSDYEKTVLLAIPRGGVPVAYQVAKELGIPFSIVITKKLASLANPEFAFGAIAPDGTYLTDERTQFYLKYSEESFNTIKDRAFAEVQRRMGKFKGGKEIDVKDKTVVIIDDGIATGYTAMVAAKYMKNQGASKVILAVPVGPADSLERVKELVFDEVICVQIEDSPSFAVGAYYEDFHQLSDNEMFTYLNQAESENLYLASEKNAVSMV